jgi:hypothetical protein
MRDRTWTDRSSEILAAAQAGERTKAPGKGSFTNALIWALKNFARQEDLGARSFTTSQLAHELIKAPHFPEHQAPSLLERNAYSVKRIVLAPFPREGEQGYKGGPKLSETPPKEPLPKRKTHIELRYVFDQHPTQEEIKALQQSVKYMKQTNQTSLARVVWGGLHHSHWNVALSAARRFKSLSASGRLRPETESQSPEENLSQTPDSQTSEACCDDPSHPSDNCSRQTARLTIPSSKGTIQDGQSPPSAISQDSGSECLTVYTPVYREMEDRVGYKCSNCEQRENRIKMSSLVSWVMNSISKGLSFIFGKLFQLVSAACRSLQ